MKFKAVDRTKKTFQSRNGLIWTVVNMLIELMLKHFNPATVWFEPQGTRRDANQQRNFNPATVWFEHDLYTLLAAWRGDFNPATVWFERVCPECDKPLFPVISIPQRSDLNAWIFSQSMLKIMISIPQRSDLNFRGENMNITAYK